MNSVSWPWKFRIASWDCHGDMIGLCIFIYTLLYIYTYDDDDDDDVIYIYTFDDLYVYLNIYIWWCYIYIYIRLYVYIYIYIWLTIYIYTYALLLLEKVVLDVYLYTVASQSLCFDTCDALPSWVFELKHIVMLQRLCTFTLKHEACNGQVLTWWDAENVFLSVCFVCVCAILTLHVSDTTKHVFQHEQKKTHLSDPVSWWINCLHMGTCFNFWMQFPNKSRCLSKCCVNQEQQPYIFFPRLPICRQNDWFATGLWIPNRVATGKTYYPRIWVCNGAIEVTSDPSFWASMKHDLRIQKWGVIQSLMKPIKL